MEIEMSEGLARSIILGGAICPNCGASSACIVIDGIEVRCQMCDGGDPDTSRERAREAISLAEAVLFDFEGRSLVVLSEEEAEEVSSSLEANLFDDNGGATDGPSWLLPYNELPHSRRDIGEGVNGFSIKYDESMRPAFLESGIKQWMGSSVAGVAYVVATQEEMDRLAVLILKSQYKGEYWQHKKSGEIFWVETDSEGKVIGACGPLHHNDVTLANLERDRCDFNEDFEVSEGIKDDADSYRLVELKEVANAV